MKSASNYLFSIIVVSFLTNCSLNVNNHETGTVKDVIHIDIKLADIINEGKVSDYFDLVKIIPLETNTNCLIGTKHQLIHFENRLYILDKGQGTLFVFDSDGRFIFKVGEKGDVPQDFMFIGNFFLDKAGRKIYLNDAGAKKIFQYSLDGHLEKTILMKKVAGLFGVTTQSNIAITYINTDYSINLVNRKGRNLRKFIPFDNKFHLASKICPFYQFDNSLYYWQDLNDTIYSIEGFDCNPAVIVDFGKYGLSREQYLNEIEYNEPGNLRPPPKFMYNINYYFEGEYFIFFKFLYDYKGISAYYQAIYEKETNQSIIFSPSVFNDYFNHEYFPKFYDISDNTFISCLSPISLINSEKQKNVGENNIKEIDDKYLSMINKLDSRDNLVLIYYKLKNK